MDNEKIQKENPLGTKPLGRLLCSLAIPAIIANVVNALYNIVDQIFIGNYDGYYGNAVTSVSFPLTTICMAIGLMTGLGAASGFNLELGRKNEEKARKIAGTAAGFLLIAGVVICIIVRIFLTPMLTMFGATDSIMPYAQTYAGITSFGIPFLLFSTGTNPLVRADRSPTYSMAAIVTGAVLNTILDPTLIFALDMGIAGAAWATVISQIVSAVMLVLYFPKFKSVHFENKDYIPRAAELFIIFKLGLNSFVFQFSNLLVQVTLNNMLKSYGEQSIYGSDIPIAAAGIVMKIFSTSADADNKLTLLEYGTRQHSGGGHAGRGGFADNACSCTEYGVVSEAERGWRKSRNTVAFAGRKKTGDQFHQIKTKETLIDSLISVWGVGVRVSGGHRCQGQQHRPSRQARPAPRIAASDLLQTSK